MNDPNCGCKSSSNPNTGEYLLVKSTASEASTCGVGSGSDPTASCDKQEPMFDSSMSDFVLPDVNGNTSMEVCNASIYSVGMWIEFNSPIASMQIVNITGNILSLVNRCANGEPIDGNPTAGAVVHRGATFVVTGGPNCFTDAEDAERINSALATLEQLCIPNMIVSSETATIRPVGKIESDTADTGVKKCLKMIYGILFKAGTPVLTALKLIDNVDRPSYRVLVKNKITNEVGHIKNWSETPDLTNESNVIMVNKNREVLVPAYLMYILKSVIKERASASDPTVWPSSGDYSETFSLNYAPINQLINDRDHFYAVVRLEIACYDTSGLHSLLASLNGLIVGGVMVDGTGDASGVQKNSITTYVKVLKSNYQLILNMNLSVAMRNYFKISLEGIYY